MHCSVGGSGGALRAGLLGGEVGRGVVGQCSRGDLGSWFCTLVLWWEEDRDPPASWVQSLRNSELLASDAPCQVALLS